CSCVLPPRARSPVQRGARAPGRRPLPASAMTVRHDSRFVSVLAVSTSGDAARVDMPLTASIAWSGFLHSRSPPPEGQTMQFSKRSYTAIGAFAAIALSAGFVGCSGGDTSGGDASGGDAAGELKDT